MQLPIGYDDFGQILENKLDFIDKTLFIKDVLDDKNTNAIVITRPRRFGKTLNLSMLNYFLSAKVYNKPTQGLFNNLNIARCGNDYMQHQGKYPIVSISFKDVKDKTFKGTYKNLCIIMQSLYTEHSYLLKSSHLQENEKVTYRKFLENELDIDESLMRFALKYITQFLYQHHGIKPWLLVDEYDSPIHAAYTLDSAVFKFEKTE